MEPLQRRQRKFVLREVYREGNRVVKCFQYPVGAKRPRPVWAIEHRALCRLGRESFGFTRHIEGDKVNIRFEKPWVPGKPLECLKPEHMSALAKCLQAIHRHAILCGDPQIENFLLDEAGEIHLVDFGRAQCFLWRSPWFFLRLGHEFERLYREGLLYNSDCIKRFSEMYANSLATWQRLLVGTGYRLSRWSRGRRKA